MSIMGPSVHTAQRWMAGLVLGTAILGLSACSTPKRPPPKIEAAPPPVVVALPPVVPVAPVQHKVALLVPVTGENAAVGQSIANAANMALLDSGNASVKLTVYDTAPGAAQAANRALGDGASVFLGPLLAPDVRVAVPLAAAHGVPVISFSNDATLAPGAYVMGFQPGESIARVVAFARSKGVERFAALIPAGAYGQRASTAFVKSVQASGGKVTAIETFVRDRKKLLVSVRRITDYETRVAKTAQAGMVRQDGTIAPVANRLAPVAFQALLIADSGNVASAFLPALAQYGVGNTNVRLLGPELWNSEPGIARIPALKGAWFASVPDGRFAQLSARYVTRFGGAPSRLASLGYDAVLLVNSVGTRWALGQPFPRRALDDEDGYAGIDGIFRFRSGVAERGLEVQQVGPTGFVTVAVAPKAFR